MRIATALSGQSTGVGHEPSDRGEPPAEPEPAPPDEPQTSPGEQEVPPEPEED
jgi:hypothetical protein